MGGFAMCQAIVITPPPPFECSSSLDCTLPATIGERPDWQWNILYEPGSSYDFFFLNLSGQ